MPTPMELLFGLRVSQPTQLVVRSDKVETLPLLVTSPTAGERSISCDGETWTVDLAAGDHLVRIEGEFAAKRQLTLSTKVAIVICEPKRPPSAECVLKWWWVTPGTPIALTGSKDPWPPPMELASPPLADADWLTNVLRNARDKLDSELTRHAPWP